MSAISAEDVNRLLPQTQCRQCGFSGCAAYAEAIASGQAPINRCAPGGAALAEKMGAIMGTSVNLCGEKMVAFVHCRGNAADTTVDFQYSGMADCNAAYLLQGGPNACKEGCLHLGSCMKVCLREMPPRTELSDTHYTYCWLRQKEEFEKGGKAE